MRDKKDRLNRKAGFSLIEMMMVIGIIGILIGAGAAAYVSEIKSSRIDAGIRILNANLSQARQNAIAMRQVRRVVIDAGTLAGYSDGKISGVRTRPASIWIEGKRCEEYLFSEKAWGIDRTGNPPDNAYALTDPESFPESVAIADVDSNMVGIGSGSRDGNPEIFYIEFSPRGAIGNVYFEGRESDTRYNQIAPIIHLTRAGEIFTVNGKTSDYTDIPFNSSSLDADGDDMKERNKVQTVEVVRLTGKTRMYDFAIMNPWPLDELE